MRLDVPTPGLHLKSTNHESENQPPMNTTEVDVRISRIHSNGPDGDYFQMEVTDRRSRSTLVEVKLTPEQFALAITGASLPHDTHLEAKLGPPERIGKWHRHESTTLPVLPSDNAEWIGGNRRLSMGEDTQAALDAWLASLPEVEGGWTLDAPRQNNAHKWVIIARAYTSENPDA